MNSTIINKKRGKIYVPDRKCPIIDLTGKKINRLTVISVAPKRQKEVEWNCICDCGNYCIVFSMHIKSGNTKSCGCLQKEGAPKKHGHKSRTNASTEYVSWVSMKNRCLNNKYIGYKHYGGRGITICDRWADSFELFLLDIGFKPSPKHSLDRFPNINGNYEPSNCRWATRTEQNRNNRRNVWLEHNGESKLASQWARELNVTQTLLSSHLKKKTLSETILFLDKKRKNAKLNYNT